MSVREGLWSTEPDRPSAPVRCGVMGAPVVGDGSTVVGTTIAPEGHGAYAVSWSSTAP